MDPELYRELDLLLKAITVLFAVIGGSIGMWKYFDSARKEFRRPFWERQLALYFEVTAAAATLANIDSGKIDSATGKNQGRKRKRNSGNSTMGLWRS